MSDVAMALVFLILSILVTVFLIWWGYRQTFGKPEFKKTHDKYNLSPDVWKMLEDLDRERKEDVE